MNSLLIIKILNMLLISLCLIFTHKNSLHKFQLNSYQIKSHLNRIKQSPNQILGNIFFGLLALVAMPFDNAFVYFYLDIVFITALFTAKPKEVKKPLVYTPRVKRQIFTTVIFNLLIVTICGAFIGDRAITLSLIALYLLAPFVTLVCAALNKPIEAKIANGFIKDAKRILNSMDNMKIIGVTGSYGKTSVKHYLNTLLKAKYNVLMTPGSFNTPMGVVRTIREHLKASDEIFICEMGARHVGDIDEICKIVHPHDGIITSVGPQHLETFYTLDNIKKTKFELADSLSENGKLFLNMDDKNIASYSKGRKYIAYGINNKEGYYAKDITVSERGTQFTAVTPSGEECTYTTKLIGMHNVLNIVGAIAVAHTYGISLEKLKSQVRKLECVPHRLELSDYGSYAIIDDAYNANPSGAKAALDVFNIFDGYKIIVTPGMVELGESEDKCNREFGSHCARVCDYVILVGKKRTESILKGLTDENYDRDKIYIADTVKEGINKAFEINTYGQKKFILLENDLPDNY